MRKITFLGKSSAFASKGLWLLCAGVMSFGVYAQKVPGRVSVANEQWQKGGAYEGFTPQQEVVNLRAKNAKHFKNANGTITAQVGGPDVHYLDNTGAWQDINRNIVRSGNAFVNETNSFKSRLPLNSGAPVTMKLNSAVNFEWWSKPQLQFVNNGSVVKAINPANVAATAGKTSVQYKGIYPNVTEEFVMLNNGIENNTIISGLSADMKAMTGNASMQMKQFIPLKAGWAVRDASGKVKNGKFDTESFQISIPGTESGIYFGAIVAFDNTLTKEKALAILATPEEKRTATQNLQLKQHIFIGDYTINFVDGGIEVASVMPVKWLKDSGRAFPVTIDPTVTITPAGITSTFRSPLSHWYGYQRHADLYLASELNISGAAQITAIEYLKSNTAAARTKPTTVYMRTTAATTLTAGVAWNSPTYTGGLAPLFDGNTTQDATTGWKMVTLTSPFIYTSGNLIVMVKDVYGGSGGTQYFDISNTVTGRQAFYRVDTTDGGDGSNMALENFLPAIRITYDMINTSCAAPVSASLDNVNTTSAVLNWVAPATAPSTGYEYFVGTSATAPVDPVTPTGTTLPGVTTANVTLNPATTYYAFVRSVCGTDKSYWVSASATTPCAVFNAPFVQPFTNGTLPNCWTNTSVTNVANTLWKFAGNADAAPGNTRAAGTYAWVDGSTPYIGANDVALETPSINLATITNPELVFDYFSNSSNVTLDNNAFTVEIFNGTQWVNVYSDNSNVANWRTIRIPLTAYANTTIKVRFTVDKTAPAAGNAFNDILLDNVSIDTTPACLPPVAPVVGEVGASSVTIDWETPSVTPANGYEYEVRTSGAAGSGATGLTASGTSTSPTASVTGLGALTNYVFYVRSVCGTASTSEWVSVNFNTVPVNDNCEGAIVITPNSNYACGTTVAGSTVGATLSMAAAPCFGNPDDDVWFSFVATAESHRITIANVVAAPGGGTSVDMYFQVLEGVCGQTASLLCSDADTNNYNTLVPGETYFIRVYSYGNTTRNTFTVCIGTPPPPPANDDCEGAVALTVNPALTCTATTAGTTQSATNSMDVAPCTGTADDDVFFSFVATSASHTITIANIVAVSGTSTAMYFQVLEGTCGAQQSLLCSTAAANTVSDLTPGNTYYIRVYSNLATSRQTFTICVGTPPPPPANDECEGAIALTVNPALTCTATVTGTTLAATNSIEAAPCSGNPDDDVWYSFVATEEAHRITLSAVTAAVGTSTDTYFQVLEGVCGQFESKLCSDPLENTVTGLIPGEMYYIRVYSYAVGAAQNFTICVATLPAPPANDECDTAVSLTVNADLNCGTVTAGTTLSATNSMAAAPCGGNPDDDVWYSFVATAEAHSVSLLNVTAAIGTATDMYFQVLEGVCGQLESKLCSDPNTNSVTGLIPGDTYYIRVYGFGAGTAQNFNICVGTLPPPPANDECDAAVALTVNADLNCAAVTAGTTASATNSLAATPCTGNPDDDVWYSFVATQTTHVVSLLNVTAVTGTSTDAYFQVLEGACGALVPKQCSDPNSNNITGLTVGNTYYVRVYTVAASTANAAINFNICVGTLPAVPANDNCTGAVALTVNADLECGVTTTGSTASATLSQAAGTCSGNPDDDVWYTFVATGTSHRIVISDVVAATGISVDAYFQVLEGTCGGTLTSKLCSDANANTATGLTIGTTYYVRVYSYGATTANAAINFKICVGSFPPPPANDDCATAAVLTPGGTFETNPLVGTNVSATNSVTATGAPAVNASCGGFGTGGDVWYSAVVPASGSLTIETGVNTGAFDSVIEVYSGTCGALTYISCNDDITTTTNLYSRAVLTGRTPGEVIYARVWEYLNDATGTFKVSAYDASLSSGSFDIASFKAYPNPVKDVLNISHTSAITSVAVFNVLGQQVLAKDVNTTDAAIDMSSLADGAYMVNVTAGDYVKTIKIVKKQ